MKRKWGRRRKRDERRFENQEEEEEKVEEKEQEGRNIQVSMKYFQCLKIDLEPYEIYDNFLVLKF